MQLCKDAQLKKIFSGKMLHYDSSTMRAINIWEVINYCKLSFVPHSE